MVELNDNKDLVTHEFGYQSVTKDNQGNTLTYIVPRVIKVDFEYTVIEKDLVQRYKYNFGTTKWLDRV